ncbi:outer membrane lipoprotein carrier protein LolA [bacterium]|nr:outer membrane lipoprotein carrier protein LolA [bacterium]
MIKLLIIIIITISSSINAQDLVAEKILDRLSEKGKSYTDIFAEFSFNFSNEEQGISEDSEGKIWIKDDMYKLNMSSDLTIINNSETLWYFMKDINEVQVMDNEPDDEMNPSRIFSIYERGYEYKYIGDSTINNETFNIIYLYPNENGTLSKVVLLIDKEIMEIRSILLTDKNNGVTTYSITKFITNSNLLDELFSFKRKNYPGVEIIDLR